MSTKLTRQKFLKAMGAGAAWIALTSTPGCESAGQRSTKNARAQAGQPQAAVSGDVLSFRSRPDLSPPVVDVATPAHETAPGHVFVAPKGAGRHGPMIVDNSGQPVWFRPLQSKSELPFTALDFKVQRYRGEPVLTWWEGTTEHTTKTIIGEYVILDDSYREVTRVRAGNGYHGDHHEFLITPQGTALLTIYKPLRWDLTPVGGPEDGVVVDGIVQEIDIETGEVLFEWHSLDHVGLDESYEKVAERPGPPFDYFHINSIDVDHDGNLLVSARVTFTVYKIDRSTGEVIWRLGGKKSDFEMGPGTKTHYQHDARRQPDGTITIFDNAVPVGEQSRGIVVELDENAMTARLVREYVHPDKQVSRILSNMQVLPNGNVFVGWGNEPTFSEFSSDGELLFDAKFLPPEVHSYRSFRFPWIGTPDDEPAAVAETGSDDEVKVYASWNGATEVATWRVLAGPGPDSLKPVKSVPRDGFETTITVTTTEPYVGVQASDGSGRVLGTAKAVKAKN